MNIIGRCLPDRGLTSRPGEQRSVPVHPTVEMPVKVVKLFAGGQEYLRMLDKPPRQGARARAHRADDEEIWQATAQNSGVFSHAQASYPCPRLPTLWFANPGSLLRYLEKVRDV